MTDTVVEPQAAERDEATLDMLGGDTPGHTPAAPEAYTVIARKYRPRTFEDLIGQEAMVRTLTNAFASGRIAHAFMLTGVRGVGKTTTARLLARALNYESDTVSQPSLSELATEGRHCRAILEGRHLDVLELDAASRSKVDEMRELIDGVRYAPAQARYKVYIIDEVHMLSTQAFNALLKTLEEPPPHAKFIFATTEIRKVPVTILSRCQRFDLRRVEPGVISASLARIAEAEGFAIESEALALIARAAEGSVRDAQSLLDQALAQAEPGERIEAARVRDMLGLADRAQTIDLFEKALRGQAGPAIEAWRTLHAFGADPVTVVMDLLEHCHGASVAKIVGPEALGLPKDQSARLAAIGAALSAGTLSRLWQMLIKALSECRLAPDPAGAVEMILIRLAYVADLPGPEEALEALRGERGSGGGKPGVTGSSGGGGARSSLALAPAAAAPGLPAPQTFDEVVALIDTRRDVALRLDVETYLRLVSFRPGAIEFAPAPGAPGDLAHRLSARLKEWTGQPWLVAAQGGGGAETLRERHDKAQAEAHRQALAEPFVKAVMETFPGAEVIEVRQLGAPAADPATDDNQED